MKKKAGLVLAVLAAACLLLAACGDAFQEKIMDVFNNEVQEASSSSEPDDPVPEGTEVLSYNGKKLMFQKPAGEHRIKKIVGDEDGIFVFYVEARRFTDSDQLDYFLLAQSFDPNGAYLSKVDMRLGVKSLDDALESVELDEKRVTLTKGNDNYYGIDRETGDVSNWSYRTIYDENGVSLQSGARYYESANRMSSTLFRFTDEDGNQSIIETKEETDQTFMMAMEFLIYDGEPEDASTTFKLSIEVDAAGKKAVLSNTKLTYKLDFTDCTYTLERKYTADMLEPEPLAVSPSGKQKLYRADQGGAGDVFWGDLVMQNATGIHYVMYGLGITMPIFTGEDSIVVNEITSVRRFDAETLEELPAMAGLTFPMVPSYGDEVTPGKWIIGIGYDEKNELIIAAARDYEEEWIDVPVTLLVLDKEGNLKKEIATEQTVLSFRHNYPELCDVIIQDGSAVLSKNSAEPPPPVTVHYMEALGSGG